jgi:hypothetical protein
LPGIASSRGDGNYARGDARSRMTKGEADKAPKHGIMEPRIDYAKTAPDAGAAMMGLERYVHQSGLDRGLLELVKLRASAH